MSIFFDKFQREIEIWEYGTLEFHVDAFNLFNHAQFNLPIGDDVNTPSTFGQITSTSVTPRVMQFGLKYLYLGAGPTGIEEAENAFPEFGEGVFLRCRIPQAAFCMHQCRRISPLAACPAIRKPSVLATF